MGGGPPYLRSACRRPPAGSRRRRYSGRSPACSRTCAGRDAWVTSSTRSHLRAAGAGGLRRAEWPGCQPLPQPQAEEGPRDPKERGGGEIRAGSSWGAVGRQRDARTDTDERQEMRATRTVRGTSAGHTRPERARQAVRARLAGAWGRRALLGARPSHQPHLPMQVRPKASRWKPGLQSQR